MRGAFTHAGRNPNPALDRRLRLPLAEEEPMEPPSHETFLALCEAITKRHRPALEFLERHGLRIGELGQLAWRDIDLAGRRIRIQTGRTKARTGGQRWVPLVGDWAERLAESCPLEDRAPDRPVFPGFNAQTFRQALGRASLAVGSVTYSPHDLRHRYVSLMVLAGIDPVLVAKMAGHRKRSMTLDVYGHVLLDEPEERLDELRMGAYRVSGLAPRAGGEQEVPGK